MGYESPHRVVPKVVDRRPYPLVKVSTMCDRCGGLLLSAHRHPSGLFCGHCLDFTVRFLAPPTPAQPPR